MTVGEQAHFYIISASIVSSKASCFVTTSNTHSCSMEISNLRKNVDEQGRLDGKNSICVKKNLNLYILVQNGKRI